MNIRKRWVLAVSLFIILVVGRPFVKAGHGGGASLAGGLAGGMLGGVISGAITRSSSPRETVVVTSKQTDSLGEVTYLSNKISYLEARLAALEGRFASLEGRLVRLEKYID